MSPSKRGGLLRLTASCRCRGPARPMACAQLCIGVTLLLLSLQPALAGWTLSRATWVTHGPGAAQHSRAQDCVSPLSVCVSAQLNETQPHHCYRAPQCTSSAAQRPEEGRGVCCAVIRHMQVLWGARAGGAGIRPYAWGRQLWHRGFRLVWFYKPAEGKLCSIAVHSTA